MNTPTLKASKTREVPDSDNLINPGDIYVRELRVYNSNRVFRAAILKCPYCGMDMASISLHKIKISNFKRLLSRLGLPFGITVVPKLGCPYNKAHLFFIKNGRITPAT